MADEPVQPGAYDGKATFKPTGLDSVIGRYTLQLVTERGGVVHSMGSAVLFAPGMAMTARHVLDECGKAYGWSKENHGDFVMHALQYGSATTVFQHSVARVFTDAVCDIAVLLLRSPVESVPDAFPALSLLPPSRGEVVCAFGYPGGAVVDGQAIQVSPNGHTSRGEVLDVFVKGRDRILAPFPCFSTNLRFDDAMSGGPVFNQAGQVCGLVSRHMALEADQHYSLVALLWPASAIEVEIVWEKHPGRSKHPMLDFFRWRSAVGVNQVQIADGTVGLADFIPPVGPSSASDRLSAQVGSGDVESAGPQAEARETSKVHDAAAIRRMAKSLTDSYQNREVQGKRLRFFVSTGKGHGGKVGEFRILKRVAAIYSYVDPSEPRSELEMFCTLCHELGHWTSWRDGTRSKEYEAALAVGPSAMAGLPLEERRKILDEERRAWTNGSAIAQSVGFVDAAAFEVQVLAALGVYSKQILNLPPEDGG
jgi:hypothetical protein